MKDKIHNIEDIFREAFEGFEATPSPEMMGNILGVSFDESVEKAFSDFEPAVSARIWEDLSSSLPSEGEQAIRASFEGFEVLPSAGVWTNISEGLEGVEAEHDFDQQFQAAFGDYEVAPPAYLMDNVLENDFDHSVKRKLANYELEPSEEVWKKIRPLIPLSLVVKRHLMVLTRIAAVLIAIMLFSFLVNEYALDIFKNNNVANNATNEKLPIELVPNKASEQAPAINTTILDEALATNNARKQPVISILENQENTATDVTVSPSKVGRSSRLNSVGTSLPTVLNTVATTEIETAILNVPVIADELQREPVSLASIPTRISKLNTRQALILSPRKADLIKDELQFPSVSVTLDGTGTGFSAESNLIDIEDDADIAKMMLSYKGWYLASSFSMYNSWILNDEIRDELAGADTPDYVVDLGRSFGLGAGYQFTPNFGIEAEIVSARLSQSYRELTNFGVFNNSEARADYYYVPLSFKYQTRRLNSMNRRIPMTASVVMGAHYGHLRNYTLRNGDGDVNADNAFIQNEVGVFMGADYYMYLHPNTYLTLGARGAAGKDINNLSFADNTPYNLQLGVRVGLHYRFASRQNKWEHGIY